MADENIYVIMVFTQFEKDKTGFPNFGTERVVGYYRTLNDAMKAVGENAGDINEKTYDYALVETVREGVYPCSEERIFFKFNYEKDGYEKMKEPAFMAHFCGLTMG
jgi:hypothetical protein